MTKTSPWMMVLACAVSACSNDAGGDNVNGGAGNAVAAEAAGNGSTGLQEQGPAGASQSTPAPPTVATVGMPLGRPLGPLLDEDHHTPERTGCNAVFTGKEGTYLSVIDGELMVRTPTGRQLCAITDVQLQSLGKRGGEVLCGGVRISIRETGARQSSIESDSSSAAATLSGTQDGVTRTLEGEWGTAC